MIDLPAFYEFSVDEEFASFFEKKLESYKKQNYLLPINSTCTVNGFQTPNILYLNGDDINEKLNFIRKKLEEKCRIEFEYSHVHLIEYMNDGYQIKHNHDHNEHFSAIIYLNNCNDGQTYIILNEKVELKWFITPERGRGVMFLASLYHGGLPTSNNKKVLVLGFRVKNVL